MLCCLCKYLCFWRVTDREKQKRQETVVDFPGKSLSMRVWALFDRSAECLAPAISPGPHPDDPRFGPQTSLGLTPARGKAQKWCIRCAFRWESGKQAIAGAPWWTQLHRVDHGVTLA